MAHGPATMASPGPPKVASVPGKRHHGVVRFHVAADQLVRLGYANNFLHARHFVERAGFDLAFVPGNANRGTFRAGDGVGAIPKRLDFVAHRADCLPPWRAPA